MNNKKVKPSDSEGIVFKIFLLFLSSVLFWLSNPNIFFEDGTSVWTPYLWLFWQNKGDIFNAMTKWPWFDNVREDERYAKLLAKAKEMAEAK